jgi:hypothetical protein
VTLLSGADWGSKIFSDGWTAAQGGTMQTIEPATGEALAEVGLANKGDVAEAARQARAVLPTPAVPPTAEITVAAFSALPSSRLFSSRSSAARPAKSGTGAGSCLGITGAGSWPSAPPFGLLAGCGAPAVQRAHQLGPLLLADREHVSEQHCPVSGLTASPSTWPRPGTP